MNVNELGGRYKKERDAEVRERILIVTWLKEGKTTYEVAELLGCPQSKVMYWKTRFEKEGVNGLKTRPRPGKPKKLPEHIEDVAKEKLEKNHHGWTTKAVREMLRKESGISYSERHVARLLHKWGFKRLNHRHRRSGRAG